MRVMPACSPIQGLTPAVPGPQMLRRGCGHDGRFGSRHRPASASGWGGRGAHAVQLHPRARTSTVDPPGSNPPAWSSPSGHNQERSPQASLPNHDRALVLGSGWRAGGGDQAAATRCGGRRCVRPARVAGSRRVASSPNVRSGARCGALRGDGSLGRRWAVDFCCPQGRWQTTTCA